MTVITDRSPAAESPRTRLANASPEDAFDRLTSLASRSLAAPLALLLLVDGERVMVRSGAGLAGALREQRDFLLGESGLRRAIVRGETVVVSDAQEDAELAGAPLLAALDAASFAGVPLLEEDGTILGCLCVIDREPRAWSDEDVELLCDLADLAVEEIRRGAEAPQQGEKIFRSLIEHSADIIVIVNAGGTISYATPSVERALGYAPDELGGTSAFALIHPEDAGEVMMRFTAVLRSGSCEAPIECRARHQDGSWRTLEVRANDLLADPGVAGVVVNARDVTEERQAEQGRRRLNAFLEATPDFVATFDPRGRALSINKAFRTVSGIDDGEDLGSVTLPDLYPSAVTDVILHEGIPTAIREGVWTGETALLSAAGDEIPISQVILAHKSPGGTVEFLSTLARDITERKQAEAALRRSEEHFRSLIENATDLVHVMDEEGVIRYVSPSVEKVLGYGTDELLGSNAFDLVHPDYTDRARVAFGRRLTDTAPGEPTEMLVRHRDGEWRVFEMRANNLLEDPAVGGVVVNSRDVTERKRAETALADSQEQLLQSQKMDAVGRLAGGIAHDFNNLLTAIKGFTELLILDFDESDARRPFATEIQGAANRAAGLTRQLLAFSRKQVLQPKVLDLNAVVVDMEKMLRRLIGEDLELETVAEERLGRVKADPGQIEQVLLNLAVNARDAMPGGGQLTIETANVQLSAAQIPTGSEAEPGPFVALTVSDTGAGMPREVQERIFEPFFTTKEQGKGTGLGLSTVYGIVKQSGGIIQVDSEVGKGTSFRVFLPSVEGEAEAKVARKAAGPVKGTETVLLVEDEIAVRVLVKRVLERLGYRVMEAASGPAALALLEKHPDQAVQLLLTDVVMPGMSGRELADQLVEHIPGLRVLYMSGYTDEAIVHHGVLNPGVSFLEKPFAPDTLLAKVREVLDGVPASS